MTDATLCRTCRRPLAPGATKCPNCGSRVPRDEPPDADAPLTFPRRAPAAPEPTGALPDRGAAPARGAAPTRESVFPTLLSAALFLYVGWLGLRGTSGEALYDGSVAAFTWGARGVGVGLILVALLDLLRARVAVLLELVVTFVAAAGCIAVGAIWIAYNDSSGFLLLLFGAFNVYGLHGAWTRFRRRP